MRTLVGSPACGAVFGAVTNSVCRFKTARGLMNDASMSGYGVGERRSEHTAAVVGRQSERWRWDVEAIQAREHTLNPHDVAFDGPVTLSQVPSSILTSEDWDALWGAFF